MIGKPFTIKHFTHHIDHQGKRLLTVTYDLHIPLADPKCTPADLFGHLLSQNRLPLTFQKEIWVKFEQFVRDETLKFDAELAALRIENALNNGDNLGNTFAAGSAATSTDDGQANYDANNHRIFLSGTKADENKEENTLFEEQFQIVMRNASVNKLLLLVKEESRMTDEMRALVRVRNLEVERIKRTCEQTLAQCAINATEFDKQSYEISMLNEKLRQVSMNYSNQIEALNERQRHEYRQLVRALYADDKRVYSEENKEFASLASSLSSSDTLFTCVTPASALGQPTSSRQFKKSISCDSKLMAQQRQQQLALTISEGTANGSIGRHHWRSESFTIYIGAQLKTMHNARILTCDQLVDLLITNADSNVPANNIRHIASDHKTEICHSQRLQLLMNLYRRDLACAVFIVGDSDALWHVKERTKFAQLCEQSAELHFDSLERQLMKIEEDVRKANCERRAEAVRRRRTQQQSNGDEMTGQPSSVDELRLPGTSNNNTDGTFEWGNTGEEEENNDNYCDVNSLRPGDVYVTCHSNLSNVQVVFHVVADRELIEQDISSRHPCIGALRNVIRLASHSGVHHITFPLLLVEHMSETMTVSWCLGRAELVFKCMKGFLMEVCSSGVSIAIAGGGGVVVSASGNAGGTPHFNINFMLPSAISPALFQQLVELFSSIFHSVPSLNVTQHC